MESNYYKYFNLMHSAEAANEGVMQPAPVQKA